MEQLSEWQREFLKQATSKYHQSFKGSPAEEFLAQRGLENVEKYRFGYVESPEVGHEKYKGMLAIPYLRKHPRHGWSCVQLRFRSLSPYAKPKYLSEHGARPRLFNTPALLCDSSAVGICEGEFDAVAATLAGLPTVGLPGSTNWEPWWSEIFKGYKTVYLLGDGDDAGRKMNRQLQRELSNARNIWLPEGKDVNTLLIEEGIEGVRSLWSES